MGYSADIIIDKSHVMCESGLWVNQVLHMVKKIYRPWVAITLLQTLVLPSVAPLLAATEATACCCTTDSCNLKLRQEEKARSGGCHGTHSAHSQPAEHGDVVGHHGDGEHHGEASGHCHGSRRSTTQGLAISSTCGTSSPTAVTLPTVHKAVHSRPLTARSWAISGEAFGGGEQPPVFDRPEPPTPPPRSV